MRKPAVFLERDGILNVLVPDEVRGGVGGPITADSLALFRDAPMFVRALNDRGFLVIIVTEQPAVAAGRLNEVGLERIHRTLRASVASSGGRIDGVFVCPHDPRPFVDSPRAEFAVSCRCRKPAPGLLLRAAQTHDVDLARSFLICRDLRDVRAGRSAALETILLSDVHLNQIEATPDLRPSHVVPNLAGVVRILDAAQEAVTLR